MISLAVHQEISAQMEGLIADVVKGLGINTLPYRSQSQVHTLLERVIHCWGVKVASQVPIPTGILGASHKLPHPARAAPFQ